VLCDNLRMPRKTSGEKRGGFLTARIPEKTKYGLTLMARLHHDPPPDVLIRALNNLYSTEHIGLIVSVEGNEHPRHLLDLVWSESEAERFAKLAQARFDLLTGAEKLAWQRVKGDDRYWAGAGKGRTLNLSALEQDWPSIKASLAPEASGRGQD
jgi:hypothetical protein